MSFLVISLFALLLSACSGGSGDGGTSSNSGTLSLNLTDAPVDGLSEVWVTFTEVIIHPADSSEDIIVDVDDGEGDPGMTINLLDFTGGESVRLLDDYPLPNGTYSWMRLVIDRDKTTVVCDETPYDCYDYSGRELNELKLDCSSCDQSHLKLNRSFEIEVEDQVEFTIDFDMRSSVTLTRPNSTPYVDEQFKLRPTLRITDTNQAGTLIYGTVDETWVRNETGDEEATPDDCVVYVYEGDADAIEPDDICTIDNIDTCPEADRPLTTTGVQDSSYRTGYLEPGPYTVALLCDQEDLPGEDDEVTFIGEATVDHLDDQDSVHNFE